MENRIGVRRFLEDTRASLKSRTYEPQPVRERGIPKAGGKTRYLGIPTLRDRVVQMALKLVLEPIFEVDFCPLSYGYRPARRAQDAITEIAHYINPPSGYEYVVEGDIKACFDNVNHGVLASLIRQRITDRKALALIKAFVTVHTNLAALIWARPERGSGFSARSAPGLPIMVCKQTPMPRSGRWNRPGNKPIGDGSPNWKQKTPT